MSLDNLNKLELETEIYKLMDKVILHLKKNPDVDTFLDQTNFFDEWEFVLPEKEYPIFIMAVLNNIRKSSIIDIITNSILNKNNSEENKRISKDKDIQNISHVGEIPFN